MMTKALSTPQTSTTASGAGSTGSKAKRAKTPTGSRAQADTTAQDTTRAKPSTSAKTGLTHTNAPDLTASMLAGLGRVGYVAQLQNDQGRANAVLVRIVGMRICDNRHLYALPGPCPDCATSSTGVPA